MTILQLEYVIAVDTHKSFTKASEHCFVTQPTLSMQIKKLEEELGVLLFDRNSKPVCPTEAGKLIIAQARKVVNAATRINEIIAELRDELPKNLHLATIPTIAPYLMPSLLEVRNKNFPQIALRIDESITEEIVHQIRHNQIDFGILATPLDEEGLIEHPLYYEPFVAYFHKDHPLLQKKQINSKDISVNDMWLLTDGHCFRDQVLNFCGHGARPNKTGLSYTTGSLESIIRLINSSGGYTLLPLLAARALPLESQKYIRYFEAPVPVREISILTREDFLKARLLKLIRETIHGFLPEGLLHIDASQNRIPIK